MKSRRSCEIETRKYFRANRVRGPPAHCYPIVARALAHLPWGQEVPPLGPRAGGLALMQRWTTTTKTFTCFVFSFCLQGVQLLFSQILQYILKLRKELQLGQVRQHPRVTLTERRPRWPADIRDLSPVIQRAHSRI